MTQYVTAAAGLLCLVAAILIATVGKMQWPRVTVALVLTGVTGILNSTVGPPIRQAVTGLDQRIGQFIGEWTGTAVTGLLALAVLAVAAFRVWQKQIDTKTLVATAAVPPTIALIPGGLGAFAATVVGVVPWLFGALATWAFGLGG